MLRQLPCVLASLSFLAASAAPAQVTLPPPTADHQAAPAPNGQSPTPPQVLRIPPEVEEDPALGPLDPGPFPQMPGYFTPRALDLNYRQTPFFGGGYYSGYGYGSQEYFPGVYPYYDAQRHYRWYIDYRRERQLMKRADSLRGEGLDAFHATDFEQAAMRFLGAAEADQGDAASRIHAGHALFALGRYADAVALLRRAFELQPTLVYMRVDPRADYNRPTDFDHHLDTLRAFVRRSPNDPAARLLLGYMRLYTQGPSAARPDVEAALRLSPNDSLAQRLYEVVSRSSLDEQVARTAGQRDNRPSDKMKIQRKNPPPYDDMRNAPKPKTVKQKKEKPIAA